MSINVQVIFYSMYGHVHHMAEAIAEGAKQVPGANVSLYQVPELIPDDVLEKYGAKGAKTAFAKSRWPQSTNWPKPTQLSSAPRRASGTWRRKCAISWIRPARSG